MKMPFWHRSDIDNAISGRQSIRCWSDIEWIPVIYINNISLIIKLFPKQTELSQATTNNAVSRFVILDAHSPR